MEIGEQSSNTLLRIKRADFSMAKLDAETGMLCLNVKLDFVAPGPEKGRHELTVYLMSDSYLGCDQELPLELNVV